jgi:hypothetical protein
MLAVLLFPTFALAAPPTVDFNRDVRPILSENCFACHGPDEKARKAKLRLDNREGALKVVDLKNLKESEFLKRLHTEDDAEIMPPAKSGKKLTAVQIRTLTSWIEQGFPYQGHWSFEAPKRPALPTASMQNPIDQFIQARLTKEKLKPLAEADKATLIRRVTLDLTGLPPTPQEVEAFLKDQSPDAYEKVVKRLLGTIQYGERMALDWLDAARYADTNGYHIDNGRDMTRWREYVIEAFHKNKPYDQFTVEQLAGDLLPGATVEQKIASGFNRNHMINFEGGAIPEEYQTAYIIDRVNTTATVWMGLTVACAQCHDHKYDPISQKEFYRLYAFFNNIPERGLDGNKGNSVPMIKLPTAKQAERMQALREEIKSLQAKLKEPWAEADAEQAVWEKTIAAADWKAIALKNPRSEGGATLRALPDGSLLAEGKNPDQETYTATFQNDLPQMKTLRLEVLPDDSLPERGPGRSTNGNFVMTGIKVLDGDKSLPIASLSADFFQKNGNFTIATLQEKGPGWAILPEVGKPREAFIQLKEPVAAGKELTVHLEFKSVFANHQFARFRLASSAATVSESKIPAAIASIRAIPNEKRTEEQKGQIRTYYREKISPLAKKLNEQMAAARKEIATIETKIPDAMVMEELTKPRDTHILLRGEYDKKGEKVMPGIPAVLPALTQENKDRANRLDLAKWLISPENPLMARVTVNRYWQMFFGTGLVKSTEDFGTQGEFPSHPELLDWLAVEFRESGWDLQKLITLIVTSQTYRQASTISKEAFANDPENRLLARGPRFRLQAEFLRDQALAVSGLLNAEVGGKSVSPYQPTGLWEELMSRSDGANWTAQSYTQSTGRDLYRRTMYTFWKRTCPPPSLATLDAPDRETCVVRRSRTNTPLQALVLMNDPTYVEAARKLAERMMKERKTTEERIAFAFELTTARKPSEKETAILKRVFEAQRDAFAKNKVAAEKLLKVGEADRDKTLDLIDLAAWAMVANTILNLDEVVTRG